MTDTYIKDLEKHIEMLETALEHNKRGFHPIMPDDIFKITKDYTIEDKSVCSFSRNLHKCAHESGIINKNWHTKSEYGWLEHWVRYTIPSGTIFQVKNYEIKKRRIKKYNMDYIKTIILHFPGVPKAKGKTFYMRSNVFLNIEAESYNEYQFDQ